jgi:hypothetical protein
MKPNAQSVTVLWIFPMKREVCSHRLPPFLSGVRGMAAGTHGMGLFREYSYRLTRTKQAKTPPLTHFQGIALSIA